MSVSDSITAINSTIRTLLALVVVGGLGVTGWYGYSTYYAERMAAEKTKRDLETAKASLEETSSKLTAATTQIRDQQATISTQTAELKQNAEKMKKMAADIEAQKKEIARLDTSLRLLKVDTRLARLEVLDQQNDPESGRLVTTIQFQEISPEGGAIDEPKRFKIMGDMVHVDHWVVKFDDKYVETADIERSTSLVLFRRIYGEFQEPSNGFPLDAVGSSPSVYSRGGEPSELEKKIWGDFWNIANDRKRAKELGIRAAHGAAISIKAQKGKAYRIILRASDGLSIQPAGAVSNANNGA